MGDEFNMATGSHRSNQAHLENLLNKIEFLEKERNKLGEELKSKENYYRVELEKLELSFEAFQDIENEKLIKEQEIAFRAKSRLADIESKCVIF